MADIGHTCMTDMDTLILDTHVYDIGLHRYG